MEIGLVGFEYAYAQGYKTISEMEGYKLIVISISPDLLKSEVNTPSHTYQDRDKHKEIDSINNFVIPFSIKIPNGINKSYVASYSEYFWVIDFKMNVPFSKDIHARVIIEIV